MLVRGPGLAASMSRYLVDRIAAIPNIELRTRTEIVALEGSRESGVKSLRWRHRDSGAEETRPIRNVFLFLGADPATEWLKGCDVAFDDRASSGPASAGACRSRPACPACSRSATCAQARSSASAARSARARRWSRRSTLFLRGRVPKWRLVPRSAW